MRLVARLFGGMKWNSFMAANPRPTYRKLLRRAGCTCARHHCAASRRGRAASDRAEYAHRRRSVIVRAAALAALAVIAAAIGAGLGYAALVLMAAGS
jgi:hypothetical protein